MNRHTTHLHGDFLDGELTAAEHEEVRRHLATCQNCRADLEQLEKLTGALTAISTSLPADEYFDGLTDRIAARTVSRSDPTIPESTGSREPQQRVIMTLIRLAAAIILLFASFFASDLRPATSTGQWTGRVAQRNYRVGDDTYIDRIPQSQAGINMVGSPTPIEQTGLTDTEK